MFDLYALPKDFPGNERSSKIADPYQRVACLEEAFARDIDDERFIPYIQLHEFETLILADPEQLASEYFEHESAILRLKKMVADKNPELINDGVETAPSKRIIREIPEYDKVSAGINIIEKIGLPLLREKCRHFAEWPDRLTTSA